MFQFIMIMYAVGVAGVYGHGRMTEPPSRASMFRFGYDTPADYNDNQRNCGGFAVQQSLGGKCGICGNPFNGPRDHEAGGRYANGIITGSYVSGQVIRVVIQITANHRGYFLFKVCPNNNVDRAATQECLDQYPLQLADGSGPKYYIDTRIGIYDIDLTLPDGLDCSQCVLQWMYRCGNNHGTAENGTSCLGCGPQEEFYACSDIEILPNDGDSETQVTENETPDTETPATEADETEAPATEAPATETPVTEATATEAPTTDAPATEAPAAENPTTNDDDQMQDSTTNQNDQTQAPTEDPLDDLPPMNKNCYAIGAFGTIGPPADMWCKINCLRGFCSEALCRCPDDEPATEDCVANGLYRGNTDIDIWCRTNCGLGFCPVSHCLCSPVVL